MCYAYGSVYYPYKRLKPVISRRPKRRTTERVLALTILLATVGLSCYLFSLQLFDSDVDGHTMETKIGFRGPLQARAEDNEDDADMQLFPHGIPGPPVTKSKQQGRKVIIPDPRRPETDERTFTTDPGQGRYTVLDTGQSSGEPTDRDTSQDADEPETEEGGKEDAPIESFNGELVGHFSGFIRRNVGEGQQIMNAFSGESRKMNVEMYDLTKPLTGNVGACSSIKLEIFSHMMCVDESDSSQMVTSGTWLAKQLAELKTIFDRDHHDRLEFVDLGAGPGLFTVMAASPTAIDSEPNKRRVVAVEPYTDNILRFHLNMQINSLTEKVTLITNVLDAPEKSGRIERRRYHIPGEKPNELPSPNRAGFKVHTIELDDIIPFVKSTHVLVRMELNATENRVLRGAERFFNSFNVRYVLMQWYPTVHKERYQEIYKFMTRHQMEPLESLGAKSPLSNALDTELPFILWRKKVDAIRKFVS